MTTTRSGKKTKGSKSRTKEREAEPEPDVGSPAPEERDQDLNPDVNGDVDMKEVEPTGWALLSLETYPTLVPSSHAAQTL